MQMQVVGARSKSVALFGAVVLAAIVVLSLAFIAGRGIFFHVDPIPVTFAIGPGGAISYHLDIKDPRKDFSFVLDNVADVEVSQSKPYEIAAKDSYLLIIIRRQVGSQVKDHAFYLYTDNSAVHVELDGKVQIDIADNRVFIDATQASVQSITFRPLGFKVPTPTPTPAPAKPANHQRPAPVPTFTPIPFVPIQPTPCPTTSSSGDTSGTGGSTCDQPPATPTATSSASPSVTAGATPSASPTDASTPSTTPDASPSATP